MESILTDREIRIGMKVESLSDFDKEVRTKFQNACKSMVGYVAVNGLPPMDYYFSGRGKMYKVSITEHLCTHCTHSE